MITVVIIVVLLIYTHYLTIYLLTSPKNNVKKAVINDV